MKFKIGDKVNYRLILSSGIWHTGTVHDFIYGGQEIVGYDICDSVTGFHHSISEYGVKPYPAEDTDGDVKITVGDKVPDISELTIKTSLNRYELKPHVKISAGDKIPNILEMCYSIGDKVVVETRMDQYEIGSVIDIVARSGVYKVRVRDNKPGLYKERGYMEKEIEGVTRIEDDKWYFASKKQYGPLDIIGFRIHKIDGTPEIIKGCVSDRLGEDRYRVRFIENNIIQNTTIEVESKDIIGVKTWYKKKFNLQEDKFAPGAKVAFYVCGKRVYGTIVKKSQRENGIQTYLVEKEGGGMEMLLLAENALTQIGIKEPVIDCCGLCIKASVNNDAINKQYVDIRNAINKQDKGEKEMDYSKCYQENQKSRKVNVLPVKVIYHNPATIVFWGDGTKTVVKASSHDEFNEFAGFCAALAKKVYGTSSMVRRIVESGIDDLNGGLALKDIPETPKAPETPKTPKVKAVPKKTAARKPAAKKPTRKAPAKADATRTKTEETAK